MPGQVTLHSDNGGSMKGATMLVQSYNHVHGHSAICFVTPGQRHAGLDAALLAIT